MADGVDPTGPMDETSPQETTDCKAVILDRRVWIVLIVLAGTMTGLAPDQVAAMLRLIVV
jgi:hypothetical protein